MRILFLSCNTGEGHNSTAQAIMDVLEQRGVACTRQDVLACLSPKFSKFICNWHVRLYRHSPGLFDASYRVLEHTTPDPDESTPVYDLLALGAEKLRDIIQQGSYDAIICVHVFCSLMLTEVRRKYGLLLPSFLVDTDYSYTPYSEKSDLDGYFVPSEAVAADCAAAGIPAQKLIPSGIPVRQSFYTRQPRDQARAELNLPEGPVVLLMCGSMGCGPLRKLTRGIAQMLPDSGMVVTFCGRNEKLLEDLSDLTDPRLRVLGYTEQVPLYMDAADFMVTKPGGLSTTEAACKHLPMVFINVVGGCEAQNFEWFIQEGYAVGSKNVDQVLELTEQLLARPERLAAMTARLEEDFQTNSAQLIADRVIQAVEQDRA